VFVSDRRTVPGGSYAAGTLLRAARPKHQRSRKQRLRGRVSCVSFLPSVQARRTMCARCAVLRDFQGQPDMSLVRTQKHRGVAQPGSAPALGLAPAERCASVPNRYSEGGRCGPSYERKLLLLLTQYVGELGSTGRRFNPASPTRNALLSASRLPHLRVSTGAGKRTATRRGEGWSSAGGSPLPGYGAGVGLSWRRSARWYLSPIPTFGGL
jgi:hypothetical protein